MSPENTTFPTGHVLAVPGNMVTKLTHVLFLATLVACATKQDEASTEPLYPMGTSDPAKKKDDAPPGEQAKKSDPAPGARDVLLVGNSVAGTVSVIDANSLDVLGTIDVLPDRAARLAEIDDDPIRSIAYSLVKRNQIVKHFEPHEGDRFVDDVLLSPDGGTLYVSRSNIGDVAAFDLTKAGHPMLWHTRVDGYKADHATLSKDGKMLVVSATTEDLVDVFDPKTGKIVGTFASGTSPHQNDFSDDGKHIYNGSIGDMTLPPSLDAFKGDRVITVVDAATLKVVRTYEFPEGVRPTVITPDEKKAYVQLSYLNGVVEYDLVKGKIGRTLDEPLSDFAKKTYPSRDDYPHDSAHHGLAMSGDGARLCDCGTIDNTISIVSTSSMTVEKTIETGNVPYWATTSPDGKRCFVSLSGDGTVAAIDYATASEVKRVKVGTFPQRSRIGRMPQIVVEKL